MGDHLEVLAEASLAVARAEEAVRDTAFATAREAIDEASGGLQELRDRWPTMTPAQRAVVGKAAAPIRQRLDAVARRLPKPARNPARA
jgi:hypothetical protein